MKDLRACRGILFDLYGTLVDINSREDDATFYKMALWLSFNGIQIERDELMQEYEKGCSELFEEGKKYSTFPEIDVPSVFRWILEQRTDKDISPGLLEEICRTFRVLSIIGLRVYPWVTGMLEKLRVEGYLLGLVSNAQRVFSEAEMRTLGIYDLFHTVVFSSDVGVQKPGARIFQEALNKLHLSPDEVIFVGNDLKCDIHGAQMLNMRTILIKSNIPSHQFEAEPDFIVYEQEMDEVEKLLAALAKKKN